MEQKSTPISILARFEVVAPHMSSIQCMSGEYPNSTQKSSKGEYPPQMMLFPCTKGHLSKKIFTATYRVGCVQKPGERGGRQPQAHTITPQFQFFIK